MRRAWIAAVLLLAACQTARLTPGTPVTLNDGQAAAVQAVVRANLPAATGAGNFSLLRAAENGSGRILVCGVVQPLQPGPKGKGTLPFRVALDPADSATLLDLGSSRYRNEVIAARCGRSGISTQNLIIVR